MTQPEVCPVTPTNPFQYKHMRSFETTLPLLTRLVWPIAVPYGSSKMPLNGRVRVRTQAGLGSRKQCHGEIMSMVTQHHPNRAAGRQAFAGRSPSRRTWSGLTGLSSSLPWVPIEKGQLKSKTIQHHTTIGMAVPGGRISAGSCEVCHCSLKGDSRRFFFFAGRGRGGEEEEKSIKSIRSLSSQFQMSLHQMSSKCEQGKEERSHLQKLLPAQVDFIGGREVKNEFLNVPHGCLSSQPRAHLQGTQCQL